MGLTLTSVRRKQLRSLNCFEVNAEMAIISIVFSTYSITPNLETFRGSIILLINALEDL
jgi:hypothetical protein